MAGVDFDVHASRKIGQERPPYTIYFSPSTRYKSASMRW